MTNKTKIITKTILFGLSAGFLISTYVTYNFFDKKEQDAAAVIHEKYKRELSSKEQNEIHQINIAQEKLHTLLKKEDVSKFDRILAIQTLRKHQLDKNALKELVDKQIAKTNRVKSLINFELNYAKNI